MKSFREYLQEAEASSKSKGTYASLDLSKKSQKSLLNWLTKQDLPNLVDPEEYHCTIIYSRKAIPEIAKWEIKLPMPVKAIGWKIFPTQDGKKCLVLEVQNSKMNDIHFKAEEELGATWDYPEFIPHITVCLDYKEENEPRNLPKFKLIFDNFSVTELDLEHSIGTIDYDDD
jgi:2'-5' RNA ligase